MARRRTQQAEYQPPNDERHLALVTSGEHEYDEDFIAESGFQIRILYQGKNVVRNRQRVFTEMAAIASSNVKPEEVI